MGNCECISDTIKTNAITSFLSSNKLPSSFVYSNIPINVTPTNYKSMLKHIDNLILNIISKIEYDIPIIFMFQRLYKLSDDMNVQKKIRSKNNHKCTLGNWNDNMEKKRCEILDCCRNCEVLFVGMAL